MKKTIALTALLLTPIAAGAAIKADFTREIAAQCAQAWHDSGHMRAQCINEQTRAAIAVIRAYRAASSHQRRVVAACLRGWRQVPIAADVSYDYAGAQWCVNGQMAAAK